MFNVKSILNAYVLKKGEFRTTPLRKENNIPVFCEDDVYVRNYDQIASDHLLAHSADGENPFIDDETWTEFEQSTIDLTLPLVTQETKILDVGVGLGNILSKLPKCKKYGADISLEYLVMCQKKDISVCKAKAENLPYRDNFFDIVIATDILEHVLDLNTVTSELHRVMKPSASLVVRVPYKEDLHPYIENGSYQFIHLRNFDEHSLDLHFAKIFGFEIEKKKFSRPKFRGTQSLQLRGIEQATEAITLLNEIPDSFGFTPNVRNALSAVKDDEILHFMNALASVYPDTFSKMEKIMCLPTEINAVYKKMNN